MKDWSVTLTRIGEFMLKRIGTVWYSAQQDISIYSQKIFGTVWYLYNSITQKDALQKEKQRQVDYEI